MCTSAWYRQVRMVFGQEARGWRLLMGVLCGMGGNRAALLLSYRGKGACVCMCAYAFVRACVCMFSLYTHVACDELSWKLSVRARSGFVKTNAMSQAEFYGQDSNDERRLFRQMMRALPLTQSSQEVRWWR